MLNINIPTAEEVVAYLNAIGTDYSHWIGTYGASKTPGIATIKAESAQPAYCPTYGYIYFAGELLCWRAWSQRTAEPASRLHGSFKGANLRAELLAAAQSNLEKVDFLVRGRRWLPGAEALEYWSPMLRPSRAAA